MPWGLAATIGSSLIGGILGNRQAKKERRQAVQDDREKFSRIRESAEKAGFNPLTALGSPASGGFGNLPSGTIAPLASVELASNALRGVADFASGDKARRRDAQAVQDRLQRLKLERYEAGQAGAIAARTNGAVMTQRKAPPVSTVASSTRPPSAEYSLNMDDPVKPGLVPQGAQFQKNMERIAAHAQKVTPGTAVEVKPHGVTSGVMTVDNPHLPGPVSAVTFDGDEAADFWQMIGQAPFIIPQLAYQTYKKAWNEFDFDDWGNQTKGAKRLDGKGKSSNKPSKSKYDPQHFMREWQTRKGSL